MDDEVSVLCLEQNQLNAELENEYPADKNNEISIESKTTNFSHIETEEISGFKNSKVNTDSPCSEGRTEDLVCTADKATESDIQPDKNSNETSSQTENQSLTYPVSIVETHIQEKNTKKHVANTLTNENYSVKECYVSDLNASQEHKKLKESKIKENKCNYTVITTSKPNENVTKKCDANYLSSIKIQSNIPNTSKVINCDQKQKILVHCPKDKFTALKTKLIKTASNGKTMLVASPPRTGIVKFVKQPASVIHKTQKNNNPVIIPKIVKLKDISDKKQSILDITGVVKKSQNKSCDTNVNKIVIKRNQLTDFSKLNSTSILETPESSESPKKIEKTDTNVNIFNLKSLIKQLPQVDGNKSSNVRNSSMKPRQRKQILVVKDIGDEEFEVVTNKSTFMPFNKKRHRRAIRVMPNMNVKIENSMHIYSSDSIFNTSSNHKNIKILDSQLANISTQLPQTNTIIVDSRTGVIKKPTSKQTVVSKTRLSNAVNVSASNTTTVTVNNTKVKNPHRKRSKRKLVSILPETPHTRQKSKKRSYKSDYSPYDNPSTDNFRRSTNSPINKKPSFALRPRKDLKSPAKFSEHNDVTSPSKNIDEKSGSNNKLPNNANLNVGINKKSNSVNKCSHSDLPKIKSKEAEDEINSESKCDQSKNEKDDVIEDVTNDSPFIDNGEEDCVFSNLSDDLANDTLNVETNVQQEAACDLNSDVVSLKKHSSGAAIEKTDESCKVNRTNAVNNAEFNKRKSIDQKKHTIYETSTPSRKRRRTRKDSLTPKSARKRKLSVSSTPPAKSDILIPFLNKTITETSTKLTLDEKKISSRLIGPVIRIGGSSDNQTCTIVNETTDEQVLSKCNNKVSKAPVASTNMCHILSSIPTDKSVMQEGQLTMEEKIWYCAICKKHSSYKYLGDLFGPYYEPGNEPKGNSVKKPNKQCSFVMPINLGDDWIIPKTAKGHLSICKPREMWIHEACILWSTDVYLIGNKVYGLKEASVISLNTLCSECNEVGANIGCLNKGCNQKFHYMCAYENDCYLDEVNFSLLCRKHKGKRTKTELSACATKF